MKNYNPLKVAQTNLSGELINKRSMKKAFQILSIILFSLFSFTSSKSATVNVGDGSSNLVISSSYPAGTNIVVKAGTYNKGGGISISNQSNVTIDLTGVILDGLNHTSAGFYNILSLNNLTNVTITNGTTQNIGYRSLSLSGRNVGLILVGHTFSNNYEGCWMSDNTVWDGTDNTVVLLNSGFRNCSFTNSSYIITGGGISNGAITGLIKNFEFSGNTITGGNGGDYINIVCDNALVFNNSIQNVNLGVTNDNRCIRITGTAQIHDNTATNIGYSHFAAVWSVSFGTTVQTSNFYNNICNGSMKYSSFEFQEFAAFAISGKTTYADLVVDNNTCSNLNTSAQTSWPAAFIDNYMYGLMGGHVTLTNNKGSNWLPVPATGVFWNLAKPTVTSGNSYTGLIPLGPPPSNFLYSPSTITVPQATVGVSATPTITIGTGGSITYALTGTIPTNVTINANTGVISWNGSVATGTYPLTVSATNTFGSATTTYTLIIATAVPKPTILSSSAALSAIAVNWSVSSVSSISYFSLERNNPSTGVYSQIKKITPTAAVTYTYTDTTPVKSASYRVNIVLKDGSSLYTPVLNY